jgi:hypothetical protein
METSHAPVRTFKMRRDPSCAACSGDWSQLTIAEYDEHCMPHPVAGPVAIA